VPTVHGKVSYNVPMAVFLVLILWSSSKQSEVCQLQVLYCTLCEIHKCWNIQISNSSD